MVKSSTYALFIPTFPGLQGGQVELVNTSTIGTRGILSCASHIIGRANIRETKALIIILFLSNVIIKLMKNKISSKRSVKRQKRISYKY